MQDNIIGDGIMTSGCIPLAYLQKTFEISKRDLAAYEREGLPINANAVAIAALKMALTEDNVIYYGTPGAPGLTTAPGVREIALGNWDNIGAAAADIITSVTFLDKAGFHGPYSLALAPWRYNLLRRYACSRIEDTENPKTIILFFYHHPCLLGVSKTSQLLETMLMLREFSTERYMSRLI